MEVRALTKEEALYTKKQSMQISGQTGYMGCLQAGHWTPFYGESHGEEFQTELEEVQKFLQGASPDWQEGFRLDTDQYAYLVRPDPNGDKNNFSCYCYQSERLDSHIQHTKEGIRFITPEYQELFRIPDGGKVIVTDVRGEQNEYVCRYIDDYHLEMGKNLYHICQWREIVERNGLTCEPKLEEPAPNCETRMNQGYKIIRSMEVGKTEFVLGYRESATQPFVTWKHTDGVNHDWGDYTDSLLQATEDFRKRILEEVDYLQAQEKRQEEKEPVEQAVQNFQNNQADISDAGAWQAYQNYLQQHSGISGFGTNDKNPPKDDLEFE